MATMTQENTDRQDMECVVRRVNEGSDEVEVYLRTIGGITSMSRQELEGVIGPVEMGRRFTVHGWPDAPLTRENVELKFDDHMYLAMLDRLREQDAARRETESQESAAASNASVVSQPPQKPKAKHSWNTIRRMAGALGF